MFTTAARSLSRLALVACLLLVAIAVTPALAATTATDDSPAVEPTLVTALQLLTNDGVSAGQASALSVTGDANPGPLAHDRVGGRQVGRRREPGRPRWGRGDVQLHGLRGTRRRYAKLGGERTAHGRESEQRGCHRRGRQQCRGRPERDVRRRWRELDDSGQRKHRLRLQLLVLGRTRELEPDEHGDDQLAGTDSRGLQFPGCRLRFHQRDRRVGR